tara:strand:- start:16070 stop:17539 length:1470 start_codon:yes stop_codon:yes gene_type:complete
MLNKSIKELATSLKNKEFSSTELTTYFLDRIKRYDDKLNSFITVTAELALTQAKHADKLLASNSNNTNNNPLLGIPIAQKDIFCTKGIKTSCASKMLDNFISPYNATIIDKLNNAGSVMLGKTNMDEFAMGSSNENSFYGACYNPWDLERVPGGSSGGSAAAVAARIAPIATGTDTGGSVRQPAALCGITGIKPTYGRVSRYGMIAFASSLDQAGIFANSAQDCAILLNTMAGHDPKDSTSLNIDTPDFCKDLEKPLNNLKIGLPKEFLSDNLDSNIRAIIDNAINELKKLGATFKEISLPNTKHAIPVYYIVAPAECSSNLARFDGVRYGYRCENPKDLGDLYKRSRSEGFGAEVKKRILTGTYVLSAGYYDAYYIKAQKIRKMIADDFKSALNDVDVILGPTSPNTAFKVGEKADNPISMYLNDIYTSSVNLAGLPGMSIPAGFVNNLPVGIQLIGNYLQEAKILNVAHKYQQATNWHKAMPENFNK